MYSPGFWSSVFRNCSPPSHAKYYLPEGPGDGNAPGKVNEQSLPLRVTVRWAWWRLPDRSGVPML
jgi:hypothetical protein